MFFRRTIFNISIFWYIGFIIIPLCLLLFLSFQKIGNYGEIINNFNLGNYERLLQYSQVKVFLNSLVLSFLTMLTCVLLSIAISYKLYFLRRTQSFVLLGFILCPFVINSIIRYYSYRLFISPKGLISDWFDWSIIPTDVVVMMGMISSYLPFSLIPIFIGFLKFDQEQVESCFDLGGTKLQLLFYILLPQLKKYLFSGGILVFIPALGEFVIPDLLGGAQRIFIGNVMIDQFLKFRNWPMGSAIVFTLIFIFLLFLIIQIQIKKIKIREVK